METENPECNTFLTFCKLQYPKYTTYQLIAEDGLLIASALSMRISNTLSEVTVKIQNLKHWLSHGALQIPPIHLQDILNSTITLLHNLADFSKMSHNILLFQNLILGKESTTTESSIYQIGSNGPRAPILRSIIEECLDSSLLTTTTNGSAIYLRTTDQIEQSSDEDESSDATTSPSCLDESPTNPLLE